MHCTSSTRPYWEHNYTSIDQSFLVLTKEPFIGYMPKDIYALISDEISEENLALVFVCVANKTGSLFCELDEGNEWARHAFHAWDKIHEQLMEMIFAVLIEEGCISEVPVTGKYYALKPFMERNGYHCPSGWWVPKENEKSPRS